MDLVDAAQARVALLDGPPTIEAARRAEAFLQSLPQVEIATTHVVHKGMVARTIFIPKGAGVSGMLTNLDNVNVMCGDIEVTTDDGPKRLTGYHVIPANAGFKRIGLAHEDTWWTTFWKSDLTDIEAIEDEMTSESHLLQTRRALIAQRNTIELEG